MVKHRIPFRERGKKMNITFNFVNECNIEIVSNKKIIGRIFTPSGTSRDMPSAIQVCGFDNAFDLWWCGIFSDDNGNPKQDIQLIFNDNSTSENLTTYSGCDRCYYPKDKCQCNKLKVFSKKELIMEKIDDKR